MSTLQKNKKKKDKLAPEKCLQYIFTCLFPPVGAKLILLQTKSQVMDARKKITQLLVESINAKRYSKERYLSYTFQLLVKIILELKKSLDFYFNLLLL